MADHNHMTRDVKQFGECGACDVTHLRQIVEELMLAREARMGGSYGEGQWDGYTDSADIVRRIGGLDE